MILNRIMIVGLLSDLPSLTLDLKTFCLSSCSSYDENFSL